MPTNELWTCSECQRENSAEMGFCPQCGTKNPHPAVETPAPTDRSPGGTKRLLWIAAIGLWLFGCVVLVVGGGTWWGRRLGGEEEVAAGTTPPPSATAEQAKPSPPEEENTPEPTPTSTRKPTATPTASPEVETDSIPVASNTSASGDTLSLPTPESEGVIIFLSSRDHEPETEAERRTMGKNRYLEVYAMRPDGSQQTRLSDGTHAWNFQSNYSLVMSFVPTWVIVSDYDFFDLEDRLVKATLDTTVGKNADGTNKLAMFTEFSSVGKPVSVLSVNGSLTIVTSDSDGQLVQLTHPPSGVWGDGWPSWSPDGEWISFLRDWQNPDVDGLWLINSNGDESFRIISRAESDPRRAFWSPDGEKLAYEGQNSHTDAYAFDLWVSSSDGSGQTWLTHLPSTQTAWEPRWSPDSQRIVFTIESTPRASDPGADIFVIDATGGEPKQLTNVGYYNVAPLWLPLDADDILAGGDTPLSEPPTPTPTPRPAAAAPAPSSHCPNPGVQITSPSSGATFYRRQNFIIGTANIARFHHWKIEYSTDPNGGWQYLLERDYPVDNDKLVMIDAGTIPNGPYGLRLTVVDQTGNYPQPCEIWYTNAY